MLGLADRGRVLDLFEKLMGGKIAEALADLRELYDRGADPLAVMQDLLETTHFLTRVKVAPDAEGFFDGGSSEGPALRRDGGEASRFRRSPAPGRCCSRACSKCATPRSPIAACEMALIRLSYAADLPPTEKLVRDVLDGGMHLGDATYSVFPPAGGGGATRSAWEEDRPRARARRMRRR